jgi:serine/threonine protein kinase
MGLEALLTGHLLCDRYRVARVIGRGGMGAVYRASDVRLEREVAVKVITAGTADVAIRMRLRARFHREARAAARLQHANVVTVYDFGTDPRLDLDFLVMELLQGEDMAKRLQHVGPPDVATGLEIVEQAARGLAAGHRAGLIHRDVKPGNLFLVHGGAPGRLRLCVLDFGIVQLAAEDEEATATHLTVMGRAPHSPAYAAPEQLRGEAGITPACDVWGLGATAYQILTGERPFTDSEQRRMMDGMPVPAPSARARHPRIPEPVDDLLRISLAHRAADRFRDAAAFADAVADARRGIAPAIVAFPTMGLRAAPQTDHDRTLLDPLAASPPRPTPHWNSATRAFAQPASDGTWLDPARAAPAGGQPAPVPTPYSAAAPPPARRWLRRAASAAWQMTITLAAMAVAAALGVAMFEAFYNNLTEPFYASVAGLTLSLPWAVHRIFGRRSSYPLAVLGCVVVVVGVFRFLSPLTGPETAVIALAPAQLLASAWVARITRRDRLPRTEEVALPSPSVSL